MSKHLLRTALQRLPEFAHLDCLEPFGAYTFIEYNGIDVAVSGGVSPPADLAGEGGENLIVIGFGAETKKMRSLRIKGHGNIVYIGPHTRISNITLDIVGNDNFVYLGAFASANNLFVTRHGDRTTTVVGDRSMLSVNIQIGRPDPVSLFDADGSGPFDRDTDIILREYCWIGRNVVIEPGTRLGPHSIAAQSAVVAGVFPSNCVVAGFPAILRREQVVWARTIEPTFAETHQSSHSVSLFERPLARLKKRNAELLAAEQAPVAPDEPIPSAPPAPDASILPQPAAPPLLIAVDEPILAAPLVLITADEPIPAAPPLPLALDDPMQNARVD